MIIISYKISSEETINPYCLNLYQDEDISLEYEEIIEYTYKFDCSTLYFDIKVIDNINKNEIISLLLMIANDINKYECFTHFTVINNTLINPLYASIDLKTMQVPLEDFEDIKKALIIGVQSIKKLSEIESIVDYPISIQEDVIRYQMIKEVIK